ncbi:MAG: hypothetical protein LBN33_06985 [Desulfovibrio sp.]|jgi:hypothetical protein|nr:hypothetical protein [Desulfovibrio sp.]
MFLRYIFTIPAAAALCASLAACLPQSPSLLNDGRPVPAPVTVQGMKVPGTDPRYAAARELRLKVRELADQLVAEMRDRSLSGVVAMPVSFVNLDDFKETSAFGRLLGEQLYFELNQRGYPVREYRMETAVRVKEKEGEFILSRERGSVPAESAVVIVGTYAKGPGAVFVNARLVRPSNGRVLRTASMVFEGNETVNTLLRTGVNSTNDESAARHLRETGAGAGDGLMHIRDFNTAVLPPPPPEPTPFDQGADVH